MGRLKDVLNALRGRGPVGNIARQEQIKTVSDAWASFFAKGLDSASGSTRLVMPYAQHPTVYAAISAIATNLAALPLEMFPDSDMKHETPVPGSEVLKLIEAPNETMLGSQLIEGTYIHLEHNGNAFWHLDGFAGRSSANQARFPTRIELLPMGSVQPVRDQMDRLSGWELRASRGKEALPLDRVIQFKYMNPYDTILGMGPMQAALASASGDFKQILWNESYFDNAALMTGVLTPKQGSIMDPDAMIRLRDSMEERHGGPRKHGRIGATTAPIDFLPFGTTQKDMDFVLLMQAATEKILMVWKVPPAVAGVQKDANYSAHVQQSKQFWHNHLPKTRYVEKVIKYRLCDPFGIKETPYFKTEMIRALTTDMTEVTDQARSLWNMGVPFADINDRMELGYDANHPSQQIPWVPFSLVNANDQMAAADPGPARDEPVPGDTEHPDGADTDNDPPEQEPPDAESTPSAGSSDRSGLRRGLRSVVPDKELLRATSWKILVSRIRTEEASFNKRVRDHLYDLRSEVLLNLRQHARGMKAEFEIEMVLFNEEDAANDIERRTAPVYRSAVDRGVETLLAELDIDVNPALLNPAVEEFLARKRFEIADLVDGPVSDALRRELLEGLRSGEGLEAVRERVEKVFRVSRTRARRIARTETAAAFNGGRFESMKASGIERIEWLTSRDHRVRGNDINDTANHVVLDGQVRFIGELFTNGLRFPLDPNGPPQEIVNCRCVPLPAAV